MSSEINVTGNGSLLDDDVFSDAVDATSYTFPLREWIFITTQLIKLILCAIALASDIYLIVVISKYINLQNRANNFILQYAIFNMMYLVLANLLLIIMSLSGIYEHWLYCFISNLDHLTITLSFYVLTFMAFDWYVLNYHSNIYDRYPKTFKYGAYILFSLAVPKWITTSTVCFINNWHVGKIRLHLETTSFLVCFITVMCLTILRRRKAMPSEAYKTEYAFSLPRTILLLSFFVYVIRVLMLIMESNKVLWLYMSIIYLIQEIAENLIFAAPIVIVYQLTKLNKHFRSAYFKSCKKKKVKNYDDDNLDTDSVNEVSPSNVTFDRHSEVINF